MASSYPDSVPLPLRCQCQCYIALINICPDSPVPGVVTIPAIDYVIPDWSYYPYGWGTTSEGGSVSDELQWVSVPYVSHEDCDRDYSNIGGLDDYPEGSIICTGVAGKDACQGDSGGPMQKI